VTASFITRVGEAGTWPSPPSHWSYSTLREVESCPLQYALRRATYTGSGLGGKGYPDKGAEAALFGIVLHSAVEQVVRTLRDLPDPTDPGAAVSALRARGGYPGIIAAGIADVETAMESNPRIGHRSVRLAANLRRRIPEIRSAVQGIVSRLPPSSFSVTSSPRPAGATGSTRTPLRRGSYPEARLQSAEKRFKGQIDLLSVTDTEADIVDFKSGVADEHHSEQVVLYGLLWVIDDQANPDQVPVGKLSIAYAGHEVSVSQPSDWTAVAADLDARIAAADASIEPPPAAQPSEACRWCSVRHMCEDYWRSGYRSDQPGSFGDAELRILSRHGALSWRAQLAPTGEEALVRTQSEGVTFTPGTTVRLLDIAWKRRSADDEDVGMVVLTAVSSSEMFELE
jgi:hypothetical protein